MNKKELWLRLKSYHFDHIVPSNLWEQISANFGGNNAFSKAFASKIARKHGWKNQFAIRAINEYKKFVYLGIVSEFQVSPSKIIDVVWHEHLLFSKAYRDFCKDVIEYEFDHYPELVPIDDQTGQFSAQYSDTLDLYKTEFGINPPADIWEITKYDKEKVAAGNYQSKKKTAGQNFSNTGIYSTDAALYTYFDVTGNNANIEFDAGSFGGAGASGSWNDTQDGHSESSDSGSDGSSCSSGCGGGD